MQTPFLYHATIPGTNITGTALVLGPVTYFLPCDMARLHAYVAPAPILLHGPIEETLAVGLRQCITAHLEAAAWDDRTLLTLLCD